jgi:hypothetical protein
MGVWGTQVPHRFFQTGQDPRRHLSNSKPIALENDLDSELYLPFRDRRSNQDTRRPTIAEQWRE